MLFKGKKKETDKKPTNNQAVPKKEVKQKKSGLLGLCKGIVVKKGAFSDDYDYS